MQVYVILDLYPQQIIVGCLTCEFSEKAKGLSISGLGKVQVPFLIISFNSYHTFDTLRYQIFWYKY